jgi:hypothetical protein
VGGDEAQRGQGVKVHREGVVPHTERNFCTETPNKTNKKKKKIHPQFLRKGERKKNKRENEHALWTRLCFFPLFVCDFFFFIFFFSFAS